MANSSTPIRIDAELLDTAKLVGSQQSRSAAQQIAHWARVGQEVEASRSISAHAIAAVLAGRRAYDTLESEDQAVVRAYQGVKKIGFKNMHFRNDIAAQALENKVITQRIKRMKIRHGKETTLLHT